MIAIELTSGHFDSLYVDEQANDTYIADVKPMRMPIVFNFRKSITNILHTFFRHKTKIFVHLIFSNVLLFQNN